jgi:putative peptidoglycan lipid II flippase
VTAAPTPATPTAAKSSGLIRSSAIYSFFTLISRFLGFARDVVLAYYLGASATFAADAYNMGFSFPNLFRRIFAEGAFASAFVPAYSKALATEGEEVADLLAADAMAVLAAGAIAVTLVAELTMPWLMYLIAPGFHGAKHDLAVHLTQIMMPYLPCMAIYAHLSGVLNGRNRFIFSAAAPILLNLWTLVAVWPAHNTLQAAYYASWGVIVAGVSQAGLLWWGVRRSGANVDIRRPRLTPAIKALIGLAVPGAIAASGSQVNIFISSMLVSQVNGARTWLTVCDRLYMLPQSLVGVAIGVALLPRLSRHVHAGDKVASHASIDEAVVFSLALSLPAAAALFAMPFFLIDGLYTRGAFTHFDALSTAQALQQYAWGVPAFVLSQLFNRVFFASQDTKTPMRFTLIAAAVNIGAGVTLFHVVGVAGIAAATSLAAWVNVLMMLTSLHQRGLYEPSAKTISRLIRVVIASAVLGGLLALASHERAVLEAPLHGLRLGPLGPKELVIVTLSALAGTAFPFLLLASGGLTLNEIKGALRRRPGESNKTVPGAQDLG